MKNNTLFMNIIHLSNTTPLTNSPCNDEIHLFTQFFVHNDFQRKKEINHCLNSNIHNSHINHIHLLNEKLYSDKELNVKNTLEKNKIKQTNIGKRLSFKDIFQYIRVHQLKGYFIISNADIFFDDSIANIKCSTIHEEKIMFALLRYEYNSFTSNIYGPQLDSQDTWIFHSNHFITENQEKIMNFHLGQPGCDNKFIYLLMILGFDVINDPNFIKTYHYHTETTRNYTMKERVEKPYGLIVPCHYNPLNMKNYEGFMQQVCNYTNGFKNVMFNNNKTLFQYIETKLANHQPFVVPRVSGIENNVAVFGRMCKIQGGVSPNIQNYFQQVMGAMKNNAGIKISNMHSILKYSDMYLNAFEKCEMFAGWEINGNYIGHIKQSYDYILQNYGTNREIIWAFNFDIFHYIYNQPWTFALKGKKILLISCFEESLKKQIPIREKIYDGIDLFPECEFKTLKPPITNADNPSKEFHIELEMFNKQLDAMKDQYDVALVSAGGYSTIICGHIYDSGKSAIQVSGVLQMYFGILGKRWLKERKDVVQLFMNEHWTKPLDCEKPKNWTNIEGGCYWL